MGRLIFVLGGARSGKSRFAEEQAHELAGSDVLYVATAQVGDDEMRSRVEKHQKQRPATWRTLEVIRDLGPTLASRVGGARAVLLDCLSMLVASPFIASDVDASDAANEDALQATVEKEVTALLNCVDALDVTCIVVSNEVGMGVVPAFPSGRLYRDLLGRANQQVAAQAGEVYFMVAGIPLRVK